MIVVKKFITFQNAEQIQLKVKFKSNSQAQNMNLYAIINLSIQEIGRSCRCFVQQKSRPRVNINRKFPLFSLQYRGNVLVTHKKKDRSKKHTLKKKHTQDAQQL